MKSHHDTTASFVVLMIQVGFGQCREQSVAFDLLCLYKDFHSVNLVMPASLASMN